MNEPRVFRTLAVPLGVAVLFLVLTPKLCQRVIPVAKAQHREPAPQRPVSSAGLVISSSTPAPNSQEKLHFPDGLDAGRIHYLIEIEQSFAAPSIMPVTETAPITSELLKRQYVEKKPDGTYVPTRDGLINVNGATESSDGWIVPVAQRKIERIQKVADVGDGRFDITVVWKWEPTAVGAALLPWPQEHFLVAEFAGAAGHWVLARWVLEPDQELK